MSTLTALVTGSSRGIGAAIAAQLRARGVTVIGHATRAVDEHTIPADLTDPAVIYQGGPFVRTGPFE